MQIQTDQGTHFESPLFADLLRLWSVPNSPTTAYNPRGNTACECGNRSFLGNLKRLLNEGQLMDWDLYLTLAV